MAFLKLQRASNPFDDEEFIGYGQSIVPKTNQVNHYNPFDDLERSFAFAPIQPRTVDPSSSNFPTTNQFDGFESRLNNEKKPSAVKSSMSSLASSTSSKPRSESKESMISESSQASGSFASSDEEDDEEDDEDDDQGGEYGPESLSADSVRTGDQRNRALVFMETDAPQKCECKMVISDEGTKFEFLQGDKCWMRAQKRTDGLKRLNPGINVSIWVSPLLLIAHRYDYSENSDSTTTAEISFGEMMRELDYVEEVMQTQSVKKQTLLRIGKIRGNPRQTKFHLFGPGKSHTKALGPMDARPELMAIRFERGGTNGVMALPPKTMRIRPTKGKEFLLNRLDDRTNSSGKYEQQFRFREELTTTPTPSVAGGVNVVVRKLTGVKGNNIWQFQECDSSVFSTSGSTTSSFTKEVDLAKVPTIRIVKKSLTEMTCEFKDASPAAVFALAIIIHLKSASLLKAGQSWSSLLPRLNSFHRKSSMQDVL